MKQFTAIFLCLLFCAVSGALAQQGFRVSVLNDADEPLIGAYIYVNDKPAAATDMLGLAVIPLEKIKLGDSISVSYIATKGLSVAVDQTMLNTGEYEFILDESHGTLYAEAVTVKAKIKRLYRKSLPIKRYLPHMYHARYNTHFTMNITNPGDSVPSHWMAGRLEGIYTPMLEEFINPFTGEITWRCRSVAMPGLNPDISALDSLQRSGSSLGYVNNFPLEIITNDDTIGLEQTLKYFLPRALRANNLATQRVYEPEPDFKELEIYPNVKVNYGYLGKDQDTSTFRLTYSGHKVGTTYEVVVKSDVADRINRKIREVSLSFEDTINRKSYYVKANTQNEMIIAHKSVNIGGIWQIPTVLECRIKESDRTVINITMSNIRIRGIWEEMSIPYEIMTREIPSHSNFQAYMYYECERYLERLAHDKKRAEEKEPKRKKRERDEGKY